jgi:hypothetical protein
MGAEPPAPTEPAPESDRPLGDDEAMVLNFERADIREVIHSLATALGIQLHDRSAHRGPGDDPDDREDLASRAVPALQPDPPPERHRRRSGDIYQILPVTEAKTRAIIRRGAAAAGARRDDD